MNPNARESSHGRHTVKSVDCTYGICSRYIMIYLATGRPRNLPRSDKKIGSAPACYTLRYVTVHTEDIIPDCFSHATAPLL